MGYDMHDVKEFLDEFDKGFPWHVRLKMKTIYKWRIRRMLKEVNRALEKVRKK